MVICELLVNTAIIILPSPEHEVKIFSSDFLNKISGRLDQVQGRVTAVVSKLTNWLLVVQVGQRRLLILAIWGKHHISGENTILEIIECLLCL